MCILRNPRVSEIVRVRNTPSAGILATRYSMPRRRASASFNSSPHVQAASTRSRPVAADSSIQPQQMSRKRRGSNVFGIVSAAYHSTSGSISPPQLCRISCSSRFGILRDPDPRQLRPPDAPVSPVIGISTQNASGRIVATPERGRTPKGGTAPERRTAPRLSRRVPDLHLNPTELTPVQFDRAGRIPFIDIKRRTVGELR